MRGIKVVSWQCHILSADLADFSLSRTRAKPLEEPHHKGLNASDLTHCLPACLRRKLAGSHVYFLPNTPRKRQMQLERLREGPTSPPSLSLVQLAEGIRSAALKAVSPETTNTLVHGVLRPLTWTGVASQTVPVSTCTENLSFFCGREKARNKMDSSV